MGQEKKQTIDTLNDFFIAGEETLSLASLPIPLIIISIDDGIVVYTNDAAKNSIRNCRVGEVLKGLLHDDAMRNEALEHIQKDGAYKITKKMRSDQAERKLRFIVSQDSYLGVPHFFVYVEKRTCIINSDSVVQQNNNINEYNRNNFLEKLSQSLADTKEDDENCVLIIDVDRFRVVNEKYGLKAGDSVLDTLATLIQNEIHEECFLGRLGSDEFGVSLIGVTHEEGERIANNVRENFFAHEFVWNGEQIELSVSIGLVPIQKEDRLDNVLCDLDLALRTAKENGRNCVHCSKVNDTMMSLQTDTMYFAMHIEDSLQKDKFELFAQPIVSLSNPTSQQHFEILLRSFDSEAGDYISSQELIHAAESLDMITKIDRWVCQTVFRLIGEKHLRGDDIPTVSINLSGHTIVNAAFSQEIISLARQYQVPTQSICFEITESVALKSISRAQKFISVLKKEGFRFALDDFGVGYCSFNYLQQFDVDIVKIDGVFVSTMLDNDTQFAMVKAIADVARTMNIETVAEFIENPDVIKALQMLGVDYGQGFIFGKPEPLLNLI